VVDAAGSVTVKPASGQRRPTMTDFFHAYDLRGTYPDQIGESEAERLGQAFAAHVTDASAEESPEIVVGRDGRRHGHEVTEAFVDGVLAAGVGVMDVGLAPTPAIYYASWRDDVFAVAVTASHNPPEYTGFKFSRPGGLAMSRVGGMADVERRYELLGEGDDGSGDGSGDGDGDGGSDGGGDGAGATGVSPDAGSVDAGPVHHTGVAFVEDYVDFVADRVDLAEPVSVAANFGNGVAASCGVALLERIGCDVTAVNDAIDGDFPSHPPSPGEEAARRALTDAMTDEDLGVIFDGDGDRAGFVLPGRGYVPEDQVIALMAEELLERNGGEGAVVYDLRCSQLVSERVEAAGGTPRESRVGHTFIAEAIHAEPEPGAPSVVFAGEVSGHYYFPGLGAPWDDGLLAAAFIAELASREDLAARLDAYPDYPVSPELRIDCPEGAKQGVLADVEAFYGDRETSDVDGVKVFFDAGWALVRPSNTEPKMSVRVEADSEEALERLLADVEDVVRMAIEDNS
jgi:phosphomannomutase